MNEILDQIILCKDGKGMAELGQALVKAAIKEQDKAQFKETQEDTLVDEKVLNMRKLENNGNLIWMKYDTWNSLPIMIQNKFKEVLDPLFWGGVFFNKELFECNSLELMDNIISDNIFLLIKTGKVFEILRIPIVPSEIDWMQNQKFRELSKKIGAQSILETWAPMKRVSLPDV